MKSFSIVCIALLLVGARSSGQENYRGGIVYGPKAAFNIAAPEGWVLDNESGAEQGLPCVLYPKGSSWADAKTIMYGKIASTQYEDANAFVAAAIKEMKAKRGMPKEKIASGKTHDGHDYFINEYPASKSYSQWERVAFVGRRLKRDQTRLPLSDKSVPFPEAKRRKKSHTPARPVCPRSRAAKRGAVQTALRRIRFHWRDASAVCASLPRTVSSA